jgi:hypothetical protein
MLASIIGSCHPQCAVDAPGHWTQDQYVVCLKRSSTGSGSRVAPCSSGLAVISASGLVVVVVVSAWPWGDDELDGYEEVIGAVGRASVVVLVLVGGVEQRVVGDVRTKAWMRIGWRERRSMKKKTWREWKGMMACIVACL